MIYVGTEIHGRGFRHVIAYDDMADLKKSAALWLDRRDEASEIKSRSTIDDLCHALRDAGIGFGSRSHSRISRREAFKLKRDGVEAIGF